MARDIPLLSNITARENIFIVRDHHHPDESVRHSLEIIDSLLNTFAVQECADTRIDELDTRTDFIMRLIRAAMPENAAVIMLLPLSQLHVSRTDELITWIDYLDRSAFSCDILEYEHNRGLFNTGL